jgi:hypothetical protein
MKRFTAIFLVVFTLSLAPSVMADVIINGTNVFSTNDVYTLQVPASNSFVTFKGLLNSANVSLFGFASTTEASQARLGEPMVIFPMLFDQLKVYSPTQDIATLLAPYDRVIFPLQLKGDVKSSLTLRLISITSSSTNWTNEVWGQPQLVRDLFTTPALIPKAEIDLSSTPFVVELPVFNIWFLGHRDPNNQLVLRSIIDLPPLGLNRGKVVSAGALTNLAAIAQRYPGPP